MVDFDRNIHELNIAFLQLSFDCHKANLFPDSSKVFGIPKSFLQIIETKKIKKQNAIISDFSHFQCVLFSLQPDKQFFWENILYSLDSEKYVLQVPFDASTHIQLQDFLTEFLFITYFTKLKDADRFTRFGITPRAYCFLSKLSVSDIPEIARHITGLLVSRFHNTSYWLDMEKILEVSNYKFLLEKLKAQNVSFIAQEISTLQNKNLW